ncbi:NB-ARC domain-containing protein [Deinococcus malanensis]|uniref:NB-ARC domain-containing protein n=1 Tax=Deinococcus malanensis TaxID=1706855 RepID=UPI00362869D0
METVKAASHPPAVSLYGRTRELQSILLMLRSGTRIVTLRGPGGIGKTALACLVAHQVQAEYDDVFFVDLSAVREPQQVLGTVAATLPAPERLETALSTLARAVGAAGPADSG